MIKRFVMTSHANKKGSKVTRKAIENSVREYNKSRFKIPLLMSHDYTLGIIGIIEEMEIQELEDGEVALYYTCTLLDELSPQEIKEKMRLIKPHLEIEENGKQHQIIKIGSFKYKREKDIVLKTYPKINDLLNKYELIEITNEIQLSDLGILIESNLVPYHSFFRRNHSFINNYNFDLIKAIQEFHRSHKPCKIAVKPSLDVLFLETPKYEPLELDYWRGSGFNKKFSELETDVTVHYYSNYSDKYGFNFYDIHITEFWIYEDRGRNIKTIEIEEIRNKGSKSVLYDNQDFHFTRYMHAELDISTNSVIHMDLAIRLYNQEQYSTRFNSNDIKHYTRDYGRSKTVRHKILQIDGNFGLDSMLLLVIPFFHNNPLIFEYFEETSDE